jgi:hypothetical protein
MIARVSVPQRIPSGPCARLARLRARRFRVGGRPRNAISANRGVQSVPRRSFYGDPRPQGSLSPHFGVGPLTRGDRSMPLSAQRRCSRFASAARPGFRRSTGWSRERLTPTATSRRESCLARELRSRTRSASSAVRRHGCGGRNGVRGSSTLRSGAGTPLQGRRAVADRAVLIRRSRTCGLLAGGQL